MRYVPRLRSLRENVPPRCVGELNRDGPDVTVTLFTELGGAGFRRAPARQPVLLLTMHLYLALTFRNGFDLIPAKSEGGPHGFTAAGAGRRVRMCARVGGWCGERQGGRAGRRSEPGREPGRGASPEQGRGDAAPGRGGQV